MTLIIGKFKEKFNRKLFRAYVKRNPDGSLVAFLDDKAIEEYGLSRNTYNLVLRNEDKKGGENRE